jgi:uncharacterized protein YbjT (DUF2867 family)
MNREVLVTGARGKTGREVVPLLHEAPGIVVRAGSSRPADQLTADRARVVRFDWHDRGTWEPAVAGVAAIYLVRPDLPHAPELVADLVDLAPEAYVVLLSEQGAELLAPDHWVRRVEEAVVTRAAAWTLVRPSWFHQVLTDPRFYRDSIRGDGVLPLPTSGPGIAWIDTRDIAAVVTAALLAPGDHAGRAYTLTGPAPVPAAQVAAELARRLGRPVRAVDPRPGDADGGDPWLAEILLGIYDRVRRGDFGQVTAAVETITGRPARPIEWFVREHLDQWR